MKTRKNTLLVLLSAAMFTTGCFGETKEEAAKQKAITRLKAFDKSVKQDIKEAKKVQKIQNDADFAPKAKKVVKNYIKTLRQLSSILEELGESMPNAEEAQKYSNSASSVRLKLTISSINVETADAPELRTYIAYMIRKGGKKALESSRGLSEALERD